MNVRLIINATAGLLFILTGSVSAAAAELADLAPAHTVAYVELHDLSALARELQALIKGSYLQHPALLLANHMKQGKKINEEVFNLTWFCSPEFIDELGDCQGGFLALTGLTRNDEPELVGMFRTGKSRIFPLIVRLLLLESGPIHCIARIEGVPIFQIGDAEKRPQAEIAERLRAPAVQFARQLRSPRKLSLYQVALLEDAPVEEPEEKPESGFFVSLLPDAVAFGTTPDGLSETIRRYKRKSATRTLSAEPAFRDAAEMRSKPGVSVWIDPPRLTRLVNDMLRRDLTRRLDEIRRRPPAKDEKRDPVKIREELRQLEIAHRRENREWSFLQTAANFTGMRYLAASWSLHKGEFAFRVEAHMKEKQTSPLLDLLTNQKISSNLLRAVPGDAFCLMTVPLADGASLLSRLMKLADAYAQESGEDSSLPSKALAELEKMLKLRLGRDVLGKIRSAAIAFHLVQDKETSVYPVIVLEAVSDNAAQDLMAIWPRLHAGGGKLIEPTKHTIDGQRIHSLADKPVDAGITGLPPHYGREGNLIILGWHRGRVAAILRESSRKKDLLNLPLGLAIVEAEGAISALGLFSCRQLFAHLAHVGSTAADQDMGQRRVLAYLRELSSPMAMMPPTLFSIKRLRDGMRMEFRQSNLPGASATVVDIALTWMLDAEAAPSTWLNLLFGPPQPGFLPAIGAVGGAAAAAGVPIPAAPAPAAPAPSGK